MIKEPGGTRNKIVHSLSAQTEYKVHHTKYN